MTEKEGDRHTDRRRVAKDGGQTETRVNEKG